MEKVKQYIKDTIGEMQKTVEKSGLMDGGYAEEIFSDMLTDEYSKTMAKNANFGLADRAGPACGGPG